MVTASSRADTATARAPARGRHRWPVRPCRPGRSVRPAAGGRAGVLDRDRLGDSPVELTSTSRTDHLQGNRPKLVVTEIVREPLIADDPSTPEFVDMINELALIDPSGRDHQTDREGPADDRRHLGQSPSAVSSWPSRARSTARIVGVSTA